MHTDMKRAGLAVLAATAALVWPCLAFGQASQPATRPAGPQMQAARKAVADAVAAIVQDLGSDTLERRQAAQKALTALSEMVMSEVLAQAKLADPEQAARAGELFETLAASARQGQMLLGLSARERGEVLELSRANPKAFNGLFSSNDSLAAAALAELAAKDRPGVEGVLLWACRTGGWETRLAVLEAVQDHKKPYARLGDLLLARLAVSDRFDHPDGEGNEDDSGDERQMVREVQRQAEAAALYRGLAAMKDARILPRLLKRYIRNPHDSGPFDDMGEVVELILGFNDKRTVVTLMDHVKSKDQITQFELDNNKVIKITRGDYAMTLLLFQTRQKPADYGFTDPGHEHADGFRMMGFTEDKQREAAQKKLADWWEKNRADYDGVQKIPIGPQGPDAPGREDLPEFLNNLKDG